MSIDMDIVLKKIGESVKAINKSSVTKSGDITKTELVVSLKKLSTLIQQSSPNEMCLSISQALADVFARLNDFLTEVNRKANIDYETHWESLPEED